MPRWTPDSPRVLISAAVGRSADPGDAARPGGARLGKGHALHVADPGARTRAPARVAPADRRIGGPGPTALRTAWHRRANGVAIRDRALRVASVPQSPRSRRHHGHGGDAVPKRASQS